MEVKRLVTDSQYKELQYKVNVLEKKVQELSLQLSRLILKNDALPVQSVKSQTAKKDTTKYMLDGKQYCKRRIVYECVRKYVDENKITKYEELIKVFPDYLQGSLGVVKPIDLAEKYSNAHRRFYFNDDDIIELEGKQYVVCAQWEKKNIGKILTVASSLGYQINTISVN